MNLTFAGKHLRKSETEITIMTYVRDRPVIFTYAVQYL